MNGKRVDSIGGKTYALKMAITFPSLRSQSASLFIGLNFTEELLLLFTLHSNFTTFFLFENLIFNSDIEFIYKKMILS